MDTLLFRAPGCALPLRALLARAAPALSTRAVQAGEVRVRGWRGFALRDPELEVAPGTELEWSRPSTIRGADFREGAAPRYIGLVPAPPWTAGVLANTGGGEEASLRFRRCELRSGVAELELEPSRGDAEAVRRVLALSGFPLLGDTRFGGILVEGGLRLRAALPGEGTPAQAPEGWWPSEPVFAPELSNRGEIGEGAGLEVSQASLRALSRGHPWVLTDRETGDAGRFRPGALVWIRGWETEPPGVRRTLVRVEGKGRIAARVWARDVAKLREAPSVEARVARALRRRATLLSPPSGRERTDSFRLIHGEADGLPGLAIDRFGPLLRVVVSGRSCEGFEARALEAVIGSLRTTLGSEPPVVRLVHLRERPGGALRAVELLQGKLPPSDHPAALRFPVWECGLRFWIDPGLAHPEQSSPGVGLFLDQRENRERVAALACSGGRWLNLFAHTGGFSLALLAAGAQEVVSVDLSGAYLRWLDENLELNGLRSPRHRAVRGDGRRVLARMPEAERFDGIVIDPPTAAAVGRRFWSVRRELASLVATALQHLAPGGTLLVCRNDRAPRGALARLVAEQATRMSIGLERIDAAPPGPDFPSLAAFPEGDPFEGVLVQRSRSTQRGRRKAR